MAKAGVSDRDLRRVVAASMIGATIEWYDFFLYGTVAGIVFNKLFFPVQDPLISILLAYTTFAVGFVARPVGGLIFGHFGDGLRDFFIHRTLDPVQFLLAILDGKESHLR